MSIASIIEKLEILVDASSTNVEKNEPMREVNKVMLGVIFNLCTCTNKSVRININNSITHQIVKCNVFSTFFAWKITDSDRLYVILKKEK